MKRLFSTLLIVLLCSTLFTHCVDEENYDDSPRGNFEALWKLMDEHYCFFSYKEKEIGVDWNEVHSRYAAMVNEKMNTKQLFEVCCNMLAELRDGHVNLSASFDLGRNWSFYEDHPRNYNDLLIDNYLKRDYRIASALKYRILDDNVGYVRVESFADAIGNGNLTDMITELSLCNGLIIDVRDNGGGELTNAERLAARFTNEKTHVGYIMHKTGKGHDDFSKPEKLYSTPYDGLRWQKPVVVITNRHSFSATNDFVQRMKCFPKVTILGDSTGGGSGMPFTSEIPAGWSVRYSAVVMLNRDMQHTEFGIAPDIRTSLDYQEALKGKDSMIEAARQTIKRQ